MKKGLILVLLGCMAWGCGASTTRTEAERTLRAPAGTPPTAATAVEEGNRLFTARQWDQAKAQYELAIKAQPSLAEAHYNLALALEMLGDEPSATKHYKEAANLAPGHKVIWNSPPLRRHGEVDSIWKKENSFLDANPKY